MWDFGVAKLLELFSHFLTVGLSFETLGRLNKTYLGQIWPAGHQFETSEDNMIPRPREGGL